MTHIQILWVMHDANAAVVDDIVVRHAGFFMVMHDANAAVVGDIVVRHAGLIGSYVTQTQLWWASSLCVTTDC